MFKLVSKPHPWSKKDGEQLGKRNLTVFVLGSSFFFLLPQQIVFGHLWNMLLLCDLKPGYIFWCYGEHFVNKQQHCHLISVFANTRIFTHALFAEQQRLILGVIFMDNQGPSHNVIHTFF